MCEIYKSIYSEQQTNIKGRPSDSVVTADAFIVSLRLRYTAAVIVLLFLACLMRFSILMLSSSHTHKNYTHTKYTHTKYTHTQKGVGNQ